jgi:hypothetical protein
LHFEAGNPADLAAKVDWAWNHHEEIARMGRAARVEYEAKYTPSRNYEILIGIYQKALERNSTRAGLQPAQVQAAGELNGNDHAAPLHSIGGFPLSSTESSFRR